MVGESVHIWPSPGIELIPACESFISARIRFCISSRDGKLICGELIVGLLMALLWYKLNKGERNAVTTDGLRFISGSSSHSPKIGTEITWHPRKPRISRDSEPLHNKALLDAKVVTEITQPSAHLRHEVQIACPL